VLHALLLLLLLLLVMRMRLLLLYSVQCTVADRCCVFAAYVLCDLFLLVAL
jgi:hypothetical protein